MKSPIPSGAVAISNMTAMNVDNLFWEDEGVGELAQGLISLDVFLNAILLSEKVYAITNIRIGVEDAPLIRNHPNLPVEVIPPPVVEDVSYPWEQITNVLLSDEGFKSIVTRSNQERIDNLKEFPAYRSFNLDEEVKLDARIAAGDLWRSMQLGIPFFANQLEAPICIYDQLVQLGKIPMFRRSTAQAAVKMVEQVWHTRANEANKLKGFHFFTIRMPFFLLSILRECKNPEDIWTVAAQMREERAIKAFRAWAAQVDQDTNIDRFSKEIVEIQDLAIQMKGAITKDISQTTIELGLSPTISLPLSSIKTLWSGMWRSDRHLRFLKRLFRNAVEVGKLENELCRVFKLQGDQAREVVVMLDSIGIARKQLGNS